MKCIAHIYDTISLWNGYVDVPYSPRKTTKRQLLMIHCKCLLWRKKLYTLRQIRWSTIASSAYYPVEFLNQVYHITGLFCVWALVLCCYKIPYHFNCATEQRWKTMPRTSTSKHSRKQMANKYNSNSI